MTVEREPVTIENTLLAVMGELTMERVAALLGRHPGYLTALTHPNRRETLCVRDMELLDLAYDEKTGKGYPLYLALGRRLESARAEKFADAIAIGHLAGKLAKESGEAAQALIEAALSGGDIGKLMAALKECEESDEVNDHAIALLREAISRARDGPPPAPT